MRQSPPPYDAVLELPPRFETVVWREHIDANGHMNTRHYFAFNSRAIEMAVQDAGVDQQYRDTRGMGLFTAEQQLHYHAELVEGSRLSVHVRVLARGARSVQLVSYLVDRDREQVANSLQVVVVHVDLTTRRPVAMPADVTAGFDRLLRESATSSWAQATTSAPEVFSFTAAP